MVQTMMPSKKERIVHYSRDEKDLNDYGDLAEKVCTLTYVERYTEKVQIYFICDKLPCMLCLSPNKINNTIKSLLRSETFKLYFKKGIVKVKVKLPNHKDSIIGAAATAVMVQYENDISGMLGKCCFVNLKDSNCAFFKGKDGHDSLQAFPEKEIQEVEKKEPEKEIKVIVVKEPEREKIVRHELIAYLNSGKTSTSFVQVGRPFPHYPQKEIDEIRRKYVDPPLYFHRRIPFFKGKWSEKQHVSFKESLQESWRMFIRRHTIKIKLSRKQYQGVAMIKTWFKKILRSAY